MSPLSCTINTDNQALEQIASKQAEVDRLRTDASTLRAEKEQWQVSSLPCLIGYS
jgi:FtsZ-binding cell division protein ZapB